MQEYINSIIETGLANGATIEQMMNNPELSAKAYLNSQLKAIESAGEKIKKNGLN